MRFELTAALMDDIMFSMEDHDGSFCIDTKKGVVKGGDWYDDLGDDDWDDETGETDEAGETTGADEPGRYIDLPEWDSSSGFWLMERFTATLRNALIQGELTAALDRGRGVFRAFKDTLAKYPETEKLWFAFKDREMKRAILDWYNGLREEWRLEKIGEEPEETSDLVLEDFRFRELCATDLAAEPAGDAAAWAAGARAGLAVAVESGGGEFAGFVAAHQEGGAVVVDSLRVKPAYQGLGLGEGLLTRLKERAARTPGAARVYLDLPEEARHFAAVLNREGFSPCMTRYCLEIREPDSGETHNEK